MSIQVRDARSVPSPSWGHFVDPESNERYVFVLFFCEVCAVVLLFCLPISAGVVGMRLLPFCILYVMIRRCIFVRRVPHSHCPVVTRFDPQTGLSCQV